MSQSQAPIRSFERVNAERLHETVVVQIVRQIARGSLEPGKLLPTEPEIGQQFGVSRTVIREAVRVLSTKGLISVEHGRGMRVQSRDMWHYLDPLVMFEIVSSGRGDELLDELLEIRRVFEVEAAALAARRRIPEDLASLRSLLDGMAETYDDPGKYTRMDSEFHDGILLVARNRLLREALKPVVKVVDAGRLITIRQPGAMEGSMRGHEEIYSGIEKGDPDATGEAMRRHILRFQLDIRAALNAGAVAPFRRSTGTV